MNLFVPLHPGACLPLPATDRFPEAGHLWGQAEIDALTLACAARRPLLVRGEAGSGKSQIARAAAQVLADRKVAISHGYPPVGLAEYIDLLAALHELAATCTEAEEAQKGQRVTASGSAFPRGATGRADLLRLLAVAARERVMLDLDASGWFGYKRQTEPTPRPISVHVPALVSITPTKVTRPAREGPLQMLFLHAIVRRTARPLPPGETPPEPLAEDLGPLTDEGRPTAVARAPHQLRGPDPAGSADASTAAPARNPKIGATRPRRTDPGPRDAAPAATPAASAAAALARGSGGHSRLLLALVTVPRGHALAERPLRLVGRSGVSLRILSYGPLGPWTDWLAHQNLRSALPPRPALWMLPAGAQVLIVSDLGLLLGPDSATAEAWRQLIADLRHTQVCPLALAPLGPEQLDASLPLPVLRWSPDARPRPVRARGEGKPQPDGLDDLLAMASAVRRLDPPLLRAMRRLVPAAPLNAGLEGALWCHADVDALTTASVRGDAREQHVSG